MRCRGAKFFSSTGAASTAVSSASSSANSGTCSTLQDCRPSATSSTEWDRFSVLQAFDSTATRDSFAPSKPDDWRGFKKHSAKAGKALRTKTRRARTLALFDYSDGYVLRGGMLLQQVGHSLRPAPESFRAGKRNDDRQHLLRRRRDHRSLGIARRAAVRADGIGEQWQSFQVQIIFADAFVRFAFATSAKNDVAHDVPQII